MTEHRYAPLFVGLASVEITPLDLTIRDRLHRCLVALLVRRIREEHAATMAHGFLEDMGYDDCPVCLANRRREAFGTLRRFNRCPRCGARISPPSAWLLKHHLESCERPA